jgi:hypothetical protein
MLSQVDYKQELLRNDIWQPTQAPSLIVGHVHNHGFNVHDFGIYVQDLGLHVQDLGTSVQDLGIHVQDLGYDL